MRRQMDHLDTPAGEKGVVADEEGVVPLAHNGYEGGIYLVAGGGVENLDLQSESARSRVNVSQRGRGSGSGRINEHRNTRGCGHQLTQQFQPFCYQLGTEKIDTRQVAARAGEAGDKT